eukprot:c19074_g1_i2.p1 GENE.c19074_g1_i2~~c19074_g1_i2.p1  ORF type:complete len:234 (+),score=43.95 c19074_g1_i2:83-703(+)
MAEQSLTIAQLKRTAVALSTIITQMAEGKEVDESSITDAFADTTMSPKGDVPTTSDRQGAGDSSTSEAPDDMNLKWALQQARQFSLSAREGGKVRAELQQKLAALTVQVAQLSDSKGNEQESWGDADRGLSGAVAACESVPSTSHGPKFDDVNTKLAEAMSEIENALRQTAEVGDQAEGSPAVSQRSKIEPIDEPDRAREQTNENF